MWLRAAYGPARLLLAACRLSIEHILGIPSTAVLSSNQPACTIVVDYPGLQSLQQYSRIDLSLAVYT
jgi:hypothetical protein